MGANTRMDRTVRSGGVLAEIEAWFVERGLPHFVEHRDSATAIWGRALPLLVVAYLLLGLNALDVRDWSVAENLLAAGFVILGAIVTWLVANRLRGRPMVRATSTTSAPRSWPSSSSCRLSRRSSSGSGVTRCRPW